MRAGQVRRAPDDDHDGRDLRHRRAARHQDRRRSAHAHRGAQATTRRLTQPYLRQSPHVLRRSCERPSVHDTTQTPPRRRQGRPRQSRPAGRGRRAIRRLRRHGASLRKRPLSGLAPVSRRRSFAPAYLSVWHRDPAGNWTFYATTPGRAELRPLLQFGDRQRRGPVRYRRHVDHAMVVPGDDPRTARLVGPHGDRPSRAGC